MWNNWLKAKRSLILLILGLTLSSASLADDFALSSMASQDGSKLISQQSELLKDRLAQANNELLDLQRQQEQLSALSVDDVSKQALTQAGINIAIAKSNLDSINIELSESQQTLGRLEKDIQELENQVNVTSIFGLKIARSEALNVNGLSAELNYQKNMYALEKTRNDYLLKLQEVAYSSLQLYKVKYLRINALLKSRTIMQLKEKQARSELVFQQQQSYWLKNLNNLYGQLNKLKASKSKDKDAYEKLESEIFIANENANFTYLQMLIARYHDQIHQFKILVSRGNSVNMLNNVSDQVQSLTKQLARVNGLLNTRIAILNKRINLLSQVKENPPLATLAKLKTLTEQYTLEVEHVSKQNKQLLNFRIALDRALQHELSARQSLPGLNAQAWLDLGAEILLVPTLTYHIVKSLMIGLNNTFNHLSPTLWAVIVGLELLWFASFFWLNRFLLKLTSTMSAQASGHINLKRLTVNVCARSLADVAVIGNLLIVFSFCNLPAQNYHFLVNVAWVWLLFKSIITTARICLVETPQNRAGQDVRLYHRLQWTFLIGGVITALTVFVNQLPVIYELKDLFNRLFLVFLLVVSGLLLRSSEIVPALILPHIEDKRMYLQRVVRLLGILIPLTLMVNALVGLCGYVNLVLTMSWYESIFFVVLVGYLLVRGLLSDGLEYASNVLIRHSNNGWLWTEAIMKPLDKVLRVTVFLSAWVVLFLLYGWDRQSPVVERMYKLLHYHLADVLNTTITPLSIIELCVIVSFLYWAARWTREFVYRLLATRTRDMGVRNSIAILSQYAMIVFGVLVCLKVLGIELKALAVVAGMFAFGVGLGLRDLANNFACGFLLLIERPLRVGDTVCINEHEGDVIHIGGRAVTIRTWDHMEVLVPNAEIFNKSFINWTAKDNIVRTVVGIKINRHDDPHHVQDIIYGVLASLKNVLKEPAPEVFLKELNDSVTEFEVRYYINVRMVKSRVSVRSEVLFAIWDTFEHHGIELPYPLHEIKLREGVDKLLPLLSST